MPDVLETQGLQASYGSITVVKGIDLRIETGEIVTLLGANGAGKTTILKALMGILKPSSGRILLNGVDITGQVAHQAARRGLALVPEGRRIFRRMTVRENMELGAVTRPAAEAQATMERMFGLFPRLRERQRQLGGTLSGGEQQMLAIARALMTHPRFLLMDEPSLGLAPLVVAQVFEIIARVGEETGIGVLLVEQNAAMALSVANRGYVLTRGRVVGQGAAQDLRSSEHLGAAYLGLKKG